MKKFVFLTKEIIWVYNFYNVYIYLNFMFAFMNSDSQQTKEIKLKKQWWRRVEEKEK